MKPKSNRDPAFGFICQIVLQASFAFSSRISRGKNIMNKLLTRRSALLKSALSLTLLGLIAGCGGGGTSDGGVGGGGGGGGVGGDGNDAANQTRLNVQLSFPGHDFEKSTVRPEINSQTTGAHLAVSDAADSRVHILLLDTDGSETYTLDITIVPTDPQNALNLSEGRRFDISQSNAIRISYHEKDSRNVRTDYVALAGDVQVTRANSQSFTLTLTDVSFRRSNDATNRQAFVANGVVTARKSDFVTESNSVFEAHEFGFGTPPAS